MKSIKVTAKTVDDAIQQGLQTLGGVSQEQVSINILQVAEPGSFLGFGRKDAIVELTLNECSTLSATATSKSSGDEADSAIEEEANLPVGFADYVQPAEDEHEEAYNRRESKASDPLHKAAEFLQAILTNLHIANELKFSETDSEMHFSITGDDCGILIGRRGETLRSLQYLTSLVVHHAGSDKRVHLDIGDYYEKRKQSLVNLAKRTAKRAIQTGNAYELNPMRSLDRRVIHETLAGIQGIVTYSEGEEPMRFVVIDLGEDYTQGMSMPIELVDADEESNDEAMSETDFALADNAELLDQASDLTSSL